MLSTDPIALMQEVESAISYREGRLTALEEQVHRFTGPAYAPTDSGVDGYAPENTYYEYISLMIPRLVYDNPRVQVSSRRPGAQQDVAEALRHGLNRWCKDSHLRGTLAELATDMLLSWGVCIVRQEENKGVTLPESDPIKASTPTWPVIERISQKRFFIDPQAQRWEDARFYGHVWRRDKEDLIDLAKENPDAGWNLDVIQQLATGTAEEQSERLPYSQGPDAVARKEIWCYEVWLPEVQLDGEPGPDAGFHGTIYTLGLNQAIGSYADP